MVGLIVFIVYYLIGFIGMMRIAKRDLGFVTVSELPICFMVGLIWPIFFVLVWCEKQKDKVIW